MVFVPPAICVSNPNFCEFFLLSCARGGPKSILGFLANYFFVALVEKFIKFNYVFIL